MYKVLYKVQEPNKTINVFNSVNQRTIISDKEESMEDNLKMWLNTWPNRYSKWEDKTNIQWQSALTEDWRKYK